MTVQIQDKEYKLFTALEKYLENTEYFLKFNTYSKIFNNIYKKKEKGWFKLDIQKSYSLYIYDDWIFIEIDLKDKEEIENLFKDFKKDIKIKIVRSLKND